MFNEDRYVALQAGLAPAHEEGHPQPSLSDNLAYAGFRGPRSQIAESANVAGLHTYAASGTEAIPVPVPPLAGTVPLIRESMGSWAPGGDVIRPALFSSLNLAPIRFGSMGTATPSPGPPTTPYTDQPGYDESGTNPRTRLPWKRKRGLKRLPGQVIPPGYA